MLKGCSEALQLKCYKNTGVKIDFLVPIKLSGKVIDGKK